ncbi:hypothetical protein [Subsaximicrobium wynnwilliamsii]|nr:hypothetical protein [Subsaximicrobium wynnwilliamsii]
MPLSKDHTYGHFGKVLLSRSFSFDSSSGVKGSSSTIHFFGVIAL